MASTFGKYLLLKRLAVGGMAEIWLAKQSGVQGFEKLVVVKKILEQLAVEPTFVDMFLDEARIAASLNHPHVVQIYDLGELDGAYFISMEFIAGHDLTALVRKTLLAGLTFPPELAAKVIADACQGLHYAHTKLDLRGSPLNIVHRDVSPSNILVTYDGGVKVVDFGIAKAETQSTRTKTGTLKGKVSYMSPEQLRGELVDGRSDVFALGVVLHELLVGKRLFRRTNEGAIINDILHGEVVPPSQLVPTVPKALDAVVARALQKDRNKRFASAQQMQTALERYLNSTPEPPTSIHMSNYVMRLFADEYAAYQKVLTELPRASTETLERILDEHKTVASAKSDPNRSGTHESEQASSGVRLRSARGPRFWATMVVLLAATVGGGAWLLSQRNTGDVLLETDPPGAQVTIDGARLSDRTPTSVKGLPLGTHRIHLELAGREPRDESFQLTPQTPSKSVSVGLRLAAGSLSIRSEPPGATVAVDGRAQAASTPLTAGDLDPQREHVVLFSLAGFENQTQTAHVPAGGTADVSVQLKRLPPVPPEPVPLVRAGHKGSEPSKGVLVVSSDPSADVLLDGKRLGRTPATLTLPAGKAQLTFFNRELDLSQTMSFEVPKNGRAEKAIHFEKGKLAADVKPWADVYIGEHKLGTTPLSPREVYAGHYTIRLVNSQLGEIRTVDVNVTAGQTTVVRASLK